MGLETKKFAFAVAETAGIVYLVCTLVVILFPSSSITLLGWIAHVQSSSIAARTVTFPGFILGLLQVVIYSYIIAWVFAKIYNKSLASK